LRDNNHGDLIKNTISVDFGRGEDNDAADLKQGLNDMGRSYTDKTGVHPQTLRAFVREQVESGQTLPLDLLGVFIGQKTTIKEV
jgi:predicted NACHT family NTPase